MGTWEATTTSRVPAISGTIVVVAASETFCPTRRAAHACGAHAKTSGMTIRTMNASTNGPTSTMSASSKPNR